MIMAGRGHRLMSNRNESDRVGVPADDLLRPHTSPADEAVDLSTVINKISEINTATINPSLLLSIQNQFKQMFTSKEAMRDVLSKLHAKALKDAEFGEKLIVALEVVLNCETDGPVLRGELLTFIQDDFKVKETVSKSDPATFVNSVLLLGNVYQRIKVCGEPIKVLGIALLEYFDLLIKGDEQQLKTLTKQILVNGGKLAELSKYELLEQNLRNTLVAKELSSPSKCWILLAIDFLSSGLKPLKGSLKEFYTVNLGIEYEKLEAVIGSSEPLVQSPISPSNKKTQDGSPAKSKNFNANRSGGFKKDLPQKFSDMSLKSGSVKKEKTLSSPSKTNKKDVWKSSGSGRGNSGHDDRFEKEENFYGVQRPRDVKPENPKKKNDSKDSSKQLDSPTMDLSNKTDPEVESKTQWN